MEKIINELNFKMIQEFTEISDKQLRIMECLLNEEKKINIVKVKKSKIKKLFLSFFNRRKNDSTS